MKKKPHVHLPDDYIEQIAKTLIEEYNWTASMVTIIERLKTEYHKDIFSAKADVDAKREVIGADVDELIAEFKAKQSKVAAKEKAARVSFLTNSNFWVILPTININLHGKVMLEIEWLCFGLYINFTA